MYLAKLELPYFSTLSTTFSSDNMVCDFLLQMKRNVRVSSFTYYLTSSLLLGLFIHVMSLLVDQTDLSIVTCVRAELYSNTANINIHLPWLSKA